MAKHVFVSYQHEDNDFGENLIRRVKEAGFETWIDHDHLTAGDDYRANIDQAIKDSFALIVIMSPSAKASEYVTYEWAFAWGAGIRVIPVLYKQTLLHPRLEALHYLNFTGAIRPWEDLMNVLRKSPTAISATTQSTSQNDTPSLTNTQQKTTSIWLETAHELFKREDYEEALDAYKQAILLDINNASAYAGKSRTLSRLKRYQEALIASNQAIRLDSTDTNAWRSKGIALINLDKYEEALVAYEHAIRLDSADVYSWRGKGLALANLKRYYEALVAYEQCTILNYADTFSWFNRGLALTNLKRYDEALVAYEQAIYLDSTSALTWHNKGVVLTRLKRDAEAKQAFDKAAQLGYKDQYVS